MLELLFTIQYLLNKITASALFSINIKNQKLSPPQLTNSFQIGVPSKTLSSSLVMQLHGSDIRIMQHQKHGQPCQEKHSALAVKKSPPNVTLERHEGNRSYRAQNEQFNLRWDGVDL